MSKLVLNREDAVAIGIAAGWKTCSKWNKERLASRITKLATEDEYSSIEFTDEDFEDEEEREKYNDLFAKMRQAGPNVELTQKGETSFHADPDDDFDEVESEEVESEEEVEVEEEEEKEAVKEKKKSEKPKKEKKAEEEKEKKPRPPKVKKEKKAKGGDRDQFGIRVGTQAHKVDEQILKGPQTVSEIAEATGLSRSRVTAHVGWLSNRDFVKKDDDKKVVVLEK